MTITFPRPLLDITQIASCDATLKYMITSAPTRGGLVQVADLGPSLWSFGYTTVPLLFDDANAWEAWLASFRGGLLLFQAMDARFQFPVAYQDGFSGITRSGGGAFDGTATLSSANTTTSQITMTGLPAAYQALPGDYVSFPSYSSQALHRIIEPAVASGGGVLTVTLEPPLRAGTTNGNTVLLANAYCNAVIDAGSISSSTSAEHVTTIKFTAFQALK